VREPRLVRLLGFVARVERETEDGVAYVRIDDAVTPGQVRRAHAALEERLATREPCESDVAPGRRVRVLGLMHDTGEKVLRVKVELA
jgi:hypothetical protein